MAKIAGETITLKAQFTDDSGSNTTPGTPVTITITKPDGTKSEDGTTVSEDGSTTGLFEFNYTTSVTGTYNYKFKSSDGAIEQDSFYVAPDNTG